MTALWRPIPRAPRYYVSDLGKVRDTEPSKYGPKDLFTDEDGMPCREVVQGTSKDGYKTVQLKINGRTRMFQVHRLMLETFVGPCPDGMECRHKNGKPCDNHLSNLAWGTPIENCADRVKHGTHYRGGAHWVMNQKRKRSDAHRTRMAGTS